MSRPGGGGAAAGACATACGEAVGVAGTGAAEAAGAGTCAAAARMLLGAAEEGRSGAARTGPRSKTAGSSKSSSKPARVERGCSTSLDDGATVYGVAAAAVRRGTGSACSARRKSKLDRGSDRVDEKGKHDSSNTTWREIIMRRVERSKHRYPLWEEGYPRKTQAVERGASLCCEVEDMLG